MDKWKETELEKMKIGGNSTAKDWLSKQSDWQDGSSLSAKYNSKAAALYKDKITVESQGKSWSEESSSARNHKSTFLSTSSNNNKPSSRPSSGGSMKSSQSYHGATDSCLGGGYQGGGELTGAFHQTAEFKAQKEDFFGRKQAENSMRREDLPPSQGGKYAGFGNSVSNAPSRSFSTQDFGSNLGG